MTVATLRWKLYRLAGKLVCHAREWILQIQADAEKWLLLESARLRCATLRTGTGGSTEKQEPLL